MGSWTAFSLFFLLGIFSIQHYLHSPTPRLSHLSLHRLENEFLWRESSIALLNTPGKNPTTHPVTKRSFYPSRPIPVDGLLLIFLKEEETSLRAGDRLRFRCRLYPPRGFHNPGGFSYERHLAFERIYTIGFLSEEGGWVKLGEGFKNPVTLQVERWRDHIRDFLNREAPPPSSGIFKALVLGEQGDIPEEIKETFYSYRDSPSSGHFRRSIRDRCPPFFLSADLDLKRSEFLLLSISVQKVGGWPDDPLYRPLRLHRRGRDLRDPGDHHGDHLPLFHPIQSGEKPAPYTRPGCFSHPHLLTSFPLRCFLPALLPRCAFDPLSGAAHSFESLNRTDYPFF